MLEYCIREDLKLKKARTMAVLNPVKLVIDNYPEDQIEMLEVQNNLENPELGSRQGTVRKRTVHRARKTSWRSRSANTSVCSRAMKSA